jgi:diacylglycerol kinase family enzyme
MPKPKTAFFYNPLSHTVATRGSVLEKAAGVNEAIIFELDDFSKLGAFVEQSATQGVETIFIEGGDGTIQGVLTETLLQLKGFKTRPNFVLLPGGMTNLVAANIGLKRPSVDRITDIIQNPQNRKIKTLPLLHIEPKDEGTSHFGFLLSTGALPAATQYCLDEIHTKGIGGSAAVGATLFKVLFGPKQKRRELMAPTPIQLSMADKTIDGDHLTSVATTLPKLIIGINPFWGLDDAPVQLTFADPNVRHKLINIARMFKKTQSARTRAALERDGFHSWNINDATLVHEGPIILDGEVLPLTKGPIKLSASEPLVFLS